jgi:hypothetical protein
VECKELLFSRHAIERMFERSLGPDHVREALAEGEVIADFPDDKPLPTCLMLYVSGGQPLHVVVAYNLGTQRCIIITAYRPDPGLWEPGYRTRRPQ